ncbi:MAG: aminotransferase class I/II-fold pyridoxal phosphate-dependent enzyme [Saprospiraceae bacterium]|nr:aminotransferase class I/II-fold pyridoxal phosphate-dependent enzyme [Saprospiraceae bacterium]
MKKSNQETTAIRGQIERTQYREHSVPLFLTSSFTFGSAEEMAGMFAGDIEGDVYSRYANPNTEEFIQKMCVLEGADAGFATASGMAAVWCSMAALLDSGDHIIASRALFGSTHQILSQLLPRFGITFTYVDGIQIEQWQESLTPKTKMVLLETPSNPALQIIDLRLAADFCRNHRLILNVDNCFSTPVIQNPLILGADIITHSATKYIDGQGRVLGGIVLGKQELIDKVIFFCRHTGPAMSPFNAWILSKSLETLALRMERHCQNAHTLALRLQNESKIAEVIYPFLESHPQYELAQSQMKYGGGIIGFQVKGGTDAGRNFLNKIKMCSLSANLGDSRTIATHPASTTHSKLSTAEREAVGISDGLIRISVGLEHIDDITQDILQALD